MNEKEKIEIKLVMSRREEIARVAVENYSSHPERRLGFMAGANWADKTMLDRDENGFATEECLN